jgi:FtsP/CotA-like multicopper oxidase with cupredoxin domain
LNKLILPIAVFSMIIILTSTMTVIPFIMQISGHLSHALAFTNTAIKNENTNNNGNLSNNRPISVQDYDKEKNCTTDRTKHPTTFEYLTYFNCGRVSVDKNGQTIREFTLIVHENVMVPISDSGIMFPAWTFNDTIPGPTMRMTEGDQVSITVINRNDSKHSHSLHLHSIHSANMDGVDGMGGSIAPGQSYTYKFVASPFGLYPYHCHVSPLQDHINRGLYGVMIIDPKTPREKMTEMVMLMNGYDLNFDKEGPFSIPTVEEANKMMSVSTTAPGAGGRETNSAIVTDDNSKNKDDNNNNNGNDNNGNDNNGNDNKEAAGDGRDNEIYTVNGKAFDYMYNPIQLNTGHQYRIYLVNMLEFDLINSFHTHGTLFEYYPSGTSTTPDYKNDIVTLSQADRGIVEFKYDYPGKYMFHAHVAEFTDKGWMGFFDVKDTKKLASNKVAGQETDINIEQQDGANTNTNMHGMFMPPAVENQTSSLTNQPNTESDQVIPGLL